MSKCLWVLETYDEDNKEWDPTIFGGVFLKRKAAREYCKMWKEKTTSKVRVKKYVPVDDVRCVTSNRNIIYKGMSNNLITF